MRITPRLLVWRAGKPPLRSLRFYARRSYVTDGSYSATRLYVRLYAIMLCITLSERTSNPALDNIGSAPFRITRDQPGLSVARRGGTQA